MSKPKWAVLESGTAWVVVHPGDVFRGSDGLLDCWDVHSRQHTWEEAMQEANRMARTTTVTLPAVHPRVPLMSIVQSRGDQVAFLGRGFVLTCRPGADNLERIALEILTHARKEAIKLVDHEPDTYETDDYLEKENH